MPGQLLGEHRGVDERAVRALSEVGRHGMGGVAEQRDPSAPEARRVDALHLVHEEVVDARDAGEERTGDGERVGPRRTELLDVASLERAAHRGASASEKK